MKNKKMLYKLFSIIIYINLIFNFTTTVNAFSLQEIFDKAKLFELTGLPEANNILSQQMLEEIFIPIGQVLVTIAGIVLVIVTLIMAIKYLTANAEQTPKICTVTGLLSSNGSVINFFSSLPKENAASFLASNVLTSAILIYF